MPRTKCSDTECGSGVPDGCGGTIPGCINCSVDCDCHCAGQGCQHPGGITLSLGTCEPCPSLDGAPQECNTDCINDGCDTSAPTCTCSVGAFRACP
jgi:hypothetical protein